MSQYDHPNQVKKTKKFLKTSTKENLVVFFIHFRLSHNISLTYLNTQ